MQSSSIMRIEILSDEYLDRDGMNLHSPKKCPVYARSAGKIIF
jgi:hypothetical protein